MRNFDKYFLKFIYQDCLNIFFYKFVVDVLSWHDVLIFVGFVVGVNGWIGGWVIFWVIDWVG